MGVFPCTKFNLIQSLNSDLPGFSTRPSWSQLTATQPPACTLESPEGSFPHPFLCGIYVLACTPNPNECRVFLMVLIVNIRLHRTLRTFRKNQFLLWILQFEIFENVNGIIQVLVGMSGGYKSNFVTRWAEINPVFQQM